MTTYSATGFTVFTNAATDTDVGTQTGASLQLVPTSGTNSLRYTVLPLEPGGTAPDDLFVDIDIDLSQLRLNGQNLDPDADDGPDSQIYQINWLAPGNVARSTTILILEEEGVNHPTHGTVDAAHFFRLGGDPLPNLNNLGAWNNFLDNALQSYDIPPPSSPIPPNQDILLSTLSFSSSENDVIIGSNGADDFDGGAGNDSIVGLAGDDTLSGGNGSDTLRGGNGSDELFGGNGNDYLNPGNNSNYDYLEPGAGNDTVDFSAITNANSFADISMNDLNAGVVATINGNTNRGFVNKGANGTTTILNLNNPLTASEGGLNLIGSEHNDTFNIVAGTTGWIALSGRGGNDTYNINSTDISGRLDYRSNATTGIVANLQTGIVSQDGHGGSDTINGWENLNEIRATMMNDSILGSDGRDRIILMAGNDTADGGGGFDVLRYDRSQVEAVNVNLQTGTATGIWRGEAFTHTISNFEEIRGSRQGNDTIIGRNDTDEYFEGRGGNDRLNGGGGDDTLRGDEGNDTLIGAGGDDELHGDDGNDVLFGGAGSDQLRGGAGNDSLHPGSNSEGYDALLAGAGNDTINLSSLTTDSGVGLEHWDMEAGITVWINGATNNGFVNKGANGTTQIIDVARAINNWGLDVSGSFHNDVFNITPGSNPNAFIAVVGEGGNDRFNINAGSGHVRLDFRRPDLDNGITVNLATGIVSDDGYGGQDTINGVANLGSLRATMLDDSVRGSGGDDTLILMAGNDTVNGAGGFDLLRYDRTGVEAVTLDLNTGTATGTWRGEAFTHTISNIEHVRGSRDGHDDLTGRDGQNNRIEGRGGRDTIDGGANGNDTLEGGDGNDDIAGLSGNDLIDGGNGQDLLQGEGGRDTLEGGAGADTLQGGDGWDRLEGGDGMDRLFAGDGADLLRGEDGNDTLRGGTGNDTLYGGEGNDVAYGGTGKDVLGGGNGNDRLFAGRDDDKITGGAGNDNLGGNDGNDSLNGGIGNDTIFGGNGEDTLGGGDGNDVLSAGADNDTLFGGNGDDTLNGSTGDDSFFAGAGADVLNGGAGNDTLRGGADADVLVFSTGDDQVIGFGAGDRIDLSGVAAITDFADLQANHLSGGAEAVISDGLGNTMTLVGVAEGTLDAGDFIFS
ncbi:calcium-binding protein [Ruegeria jejuensis]|uniref:calcium-binding protein n=1 Tax=Ruegeria jejuensis TaxID=3233338 RepID=UPI00355B809F